MLPSPAADPADDDLPAPMESELSPVARRALLVLWPAFLMAGVLEMLVFAVVDPSDLRWFGAEPIAWPLTAIYSVTFLIFWGGVATAGAITQLLQSPQGASPWQ
jgi:hypothetical protein